MVFLKIVKQIGSGVEKWKILDHNENLIGWKLRQDGILHLVMILSLNGILIRQIV